MKIEHNSNIIIAKNKMTNANTVLERLDYQKWIGFVENHSDIFTWKENTTEGIQIIKDIDNVPEDFKERVLASLNKISCYANFNKQKKTYDIYAGFNSKFNWITISFASTLKLEDLRVFVEMANHLDALLLKDGTDIIDERVIDSLG